MSAACDLVILGAGPAGMSAAIAASRCGLSTIVLDDQPEPGGQIYRAVERRARSGDAANLGQDDAAGAALVEAFRRCGADYRPATQVWQIERDLTVLASHAGVSSALAATAIVIATGAAERPVPIPGWTLPGVMTVGAGQILLKASAMVPPQPLWIAGQGPLPLLYAAQLIEAGMPPSGILDTTPPGALARGWRHLPGALANWRYLAKGLNYLATIKRAGVPLVRHVTEVAARGGGRLTSVRYATRGRVHEVAAATLLLHEGVVPQVQVSQSVGARHIWDDMLQAPVPVLDAWGETSLPGLFAAGDAAGIGGAALAAIRGQRAALRVAHRAGRIDDGQLQELDEATGLKMRRHDQIRPFLNAVFPPRTAIHVPGDDVIVCRCEELSARDIRQAVEAGCVGPNQVKAMTRCGMGPCQGRQCALTLQQIIADARGVPAAVLECLTIRPPLRPITLGELASLDHDRAGANRM